MQNRSYDDVQHLNLGGVVTFRLNYDKKSGKTLGLDVGGTNIKVVVVEKGEVLYQDIINSMVNGNIDVVLDRIQYLIKKAMACVEGEIEGIGIGWSSLVRPEDGKIVPLGIWSKIPSNDFAKVQRLDRLLLSTFGIPNVLIQKDGNMEAFGLLVTEGLRDTIVLNLGTTRVTCGYIDAGGLVCFDKPMELGYVEVVIGGATHGFYDNPPGSLANYVSAKGIERLAHEAGMGDISLLKTNERLKQKDKKAYLVIRNAANYLAQGIVLICKFEPTLKHIKISGGTVRGEIGKVLTDETRKFLKKFARDINIHLPIDISLSGQDVLYGGAIGAAHLVNQKIQKKKFEEELRGTAYGGTVPGMFRVMRIESIKRQVREDLSSQKPLNKQESAELIQRIIDADDFMLAEAGLRIINNRIDNIFIEVLKNQIKTAELSNEEKLKKKLEMLQNMIRNII